MTFVRRRLPPKNGLVPVLAVCAFVVCTWSIVWFLDMAPSWLKFLDVWSILAILAYSQALALSESIAILAILVLLAALLPARLFRERFVAHGTTMVLTATFWIAVFHVLVRGDPREVPIWNLLPLWVVLSLTSFVVSCSLVHRSRRLRVALSAFADRLIVLLYLYVPAGVLGLVIVTVRNIW